MPLSTEKQAPPLDIVDINGKGVAIGTGKRMVLSFFREASCPFCNFRVYVLTNNFRNLAELGLDVVAVFSSEETEVRKFIAAQPRPFRIVADPQNTAHNTYQIQRSWWGKFRAMLVHMPALFAGLRLTRGAGVTTGNLLPADFLIDETGKLVEAYYGKDAGDHIPIERIELFAARGLAAKSKSAPLPNDLLTQ